jgi:hypothetical protein
MRKLLAIALIASMPFAGVAQPLAPAQQNPLAPAATPAPQLLEQILSENAAFNTGDIRSLPLWSTPDGRILTLATAASASPVLPSSQLGAAGEWRLIDVTNLVSGGLLMRLGDRASVQVSLDQTTILAPQVAGCSPAPCASAAPLAYGGEIRLGTNWLASDKLELGVSYGTSWLKHNPIAPALASAGGYDFSFAPGIGSPLGLAGYSLLDTQSSQVSASGRFHVSDSQSVDLGASLGRVQLSAPGTALPLTSLNQAAVSFGVQYGSFGGSVTGHLLSPTDPAVFANQANRMSGLDFGVTWRAPWSGQFRFGTQNLWSSGALPSFNGPVSREIESSQARVPYVQYHQDL